MTTTTNDELDAAILAALEATNGDLVAWRTIRTKLPGDWWQQGEALTRLHETYQVSVVKIRGSCFVRLTDDFERQAAANERDRAAQTGWPLPRCRDFVAV
jgi:hypothetical protein